MVCPPCVTVCDGVAERYRNAHTAVSVMHARLSVYCQHNREDLSAMPRGMWRGGGGEGRHAQLSAYSRGCSVRCPISCHEGCGGEGRGAPHARPSKKRFNAIRQSVHRQAEAEGEAEAEAEAEAEGDVQTLCRLMLAQSWTRSVQ